MYTPFSFIKGTTAAIAAFTGAIGNVIYNTQKKTLVVQDGATQGGVELLRADLNNLAAKAVTTTMLNDGAATLAKLDQTGTAGQVLTAAGAGNAPTWTLPANAAQATETLQGTAKVATAALMNAGTDDATFATPKKLRLGFAYSFGTNGYFAFPTWLLGLVIQWGTTTAASISFPMTFPAGVLCFLPVIQFSSSTQAAAGNYTYTSATTTSGVTMAAAASALPGTLRWLALGY